MWANEPEELRTEQLNRRSALSRASEDIGEQMIVEGEQEASAR